MKLGVTRRPFAKTVTKFAFNAKTSIISRVTKPFFPNNCPIILKKHPHSFFLRNNNDVITALFKTGVQWYFGFTFLSQCLQRLKQEVTVKLVNIARGQTVCLVSEISKRFTFLVNYGEAVRKRRSLSKIAFLWLQCGTQGLGIALSMLLFLPFARGVMTEVAWLNQLKVQALIAYASVTIFCKCFQRFVS